MPETPVLTPVPGAQVRLDDNGNPIVEVATCGACGRSWNDAAVSAVTPVPAGRCPFEYEHEDAEVPDGFRVVTVRVLVRDDDVDDVTHGLIETCCHDASLSAYATDRPLAWEDLRDFGPILDDLDDLDG